MAVGWEDRVVLSPHVGDLAAVEAQESLRQVAEALPRFLDREPEIIAVDLHPDMPSTRLGESLSEERALPLVRVQHHHAHAMACLAENGHVEGLALALDGTGLGADDSIWGAELLDVDASNYRRLASFAPAPLPGGDAAVLQPARQPLAEPLSADSDVPAHPHPALASA